MRAEIFMKNQPEPLQPTHDINRAIRCMDDISCVHFPVVDADKKLKGFVSQAGLMNKKDHTRIDKIEYVGHTCFVDRNTHFLDILKIVADHNQQSVVAVMDQDHRYEGMIRTEDVVAYYTRSISIQIPGNILVLSLRISDYSLADISRRVEEHDAKIMSTTIVPDASDNEQIHVIIKINTTETSRIQATLERFNYQVVENYQQTTLEEDPFYQDRLKTFFKYLEI